MKALFSGMAALFCAAVLWAGEEDAVGDKSPGKTETLSALATIETNEVAIETNKIASLNKASSFIGSTVKSSTGKEVAKVQDLVFDAEKGQIGYAVLALCSEDKSRLVAVPLSSLKAGSDSTLTLNMSEGVLAAAEGLTDGNWPALDAFALVPSEGPAVGSGPGSESGGGSSTSTQPSKEQK